MHDPKRNTRCIRGSDDPLGTFERHRDRNFDECRLSGRDRRWRGISVDLARVRDYDNVDFIVGKCCSKIRCSMPVAELLRERCKRFVSPSHGNMEFVVRVFEGLGCQVPIMP